MKGRHILVALTSVLAILFAMTATAAAKPQATQPESAIDPGNFVRYVTNPFFPLKPGTTFYYKGEKDGVPTSDTMLVTDQTKLILGVACTIVHHQSFEDGVLIEDTFDWYAQDKDGNVWYFGEDTKEVDENGNVITTEGSWEAGVDGAQPGIIMEAHPKVGDRYQQEFAPGVAEDMAQVIRSKDDEVCVKVGCFEDDELVLTKEWTPLEPGVVEEKYYAEDVGFIKGVMVKGGDERTELVRITPKPKDN